MSQKDFLKNTVIRVKEVDNVVCLGETNSVDESDFTNDFEMIKVENLRKRFRIHLRLMNSKDENFYYMNIYKDKDISMIERRENPIKHNPHLSDDFPNLAKSKVKDFDWGLLNEDGSINTFENPSMFLKKF